jgi:hypothetical protein
MAPVDSPLLLYDDDRSIEPPTIKFAISSFNEQHGTDLYSGYFEEHSMIHIDDLPIWDDLTQLFMDKMHIKDEDIVEKFQEHLIYMLNWYNASLNGHAV